MANVQDLINAGLCSLEGVLGTETTNGCVIQIRASKSIWLIKPGESFSATADFEEEKTRLITTGALVILKGVNTFEENGNADAEETLDDDTMIVTNEGKYKFSATFTNGLYFNKALASIKGFKRWNVILVTSDGLFGTKTSTNGLTGFTTGMLQNAKLIPGSNTVGQKEGLNFQFLERAELDSDYAYIADTTARKQKGVTEVTLSYVNAPSDTDTTVTIKATLAQDASEAFTGVNFSDFLATVNGVTSNPTAGDDSATAGTYVLTMSALATGEDLIYKLYDNTNSRSVIVGADGDYYKSNSLEAEVV